MNLSQNLATYYVLNPGPLTNHRVPSQDRSELTWSGASLAWLTRFQEDVRDLQPATGLKWATGDTTLDGTNPVLAHHSPALFQARFWDVPNFHWNLTWKPFFLGFWSLTKRTRKYSRNMQKFHGKSQLIHHWSWPKVWEWPSRTDSSHSDLDSERFLGVWYV